ncbi:MAG: PQQ-binding-like beta-propeller repeat protein, partial [Pirellulales bacterium]
MRQCRDRIVAAGLLVACLMGPGWRASAEDWPHWRGPQRNGVVAEHSGFKGGEWPAGEAAWNKNVGEGSSSPLVVAGRLYTMGWRDGRDTVLCLDAATGNEIWHQSYPCPRFGRRAMGDEGLYSGPQSTPEYDAATRLLYTLSIDGDLNCWDTASQGRKVWGLNLYQQYDVPRRPQHRRSGHRDYGYTTAALAQGEWLIVEVGDDEGTLMSFDKRSGVRVWTSECKDPAGHTGGPVPITVEGVPCIAVLTYQGLLVARLDAGNEGRTVATYEWSTDFANNIATPAVHGNSVLITSGYNRNAICRIDVSLAGARKAWEQPLHSKICSPIVHQGHVY